MSQQDPGAYIDESGTAHIGRENLVGAAILTMNSGNSAPSYAVAGTLWLDNSGTPWVVKQYDGTSWMIIAVIDSTTHKLVTISTMQKQNGAPANKEVGTWWLDDSASDGTWELELYDGVDWVNFGTIDPVAHTFVPAAVVPHDHSDAANGGAAEADSVVDQGGGANLKTKVIEIGDWDMDATAQVNISHGLTKANIRSASVMVRTDSPSSDPYPLAIGNIAADGTLGTEVDGQFQIFNTGVLIRRRTGGQFDAAAFNEVAGYNRGWITIWYTA